MRTALARKRAHRVSLSSSSRHLRSVPQPSDDPLGRLYRHYQWAVDAKFDGILPRDFRVVFNPFLRRLTGRITYSQRLIEISQFHYEQYGIEDAIATLEHELLHLYLFRLRIPSGHNDHFKKVAQEKGIRVYHENPYPRNRPSPFRYLYECPECRRIVFRMRPTGEGLACGICCREHSDGRWNHRFELKLIERVRMV